MKASEIATRIFSEGQRLVLEVELLRKRSLADIEYRLGLEVLSATASIEGTTLTGEQAGELPTFPVYNIQNAQFFQESSGLVVGVNQGNIRYNESDQRVLALISQFSTGLESLELRSALDQLKVPEAEQSVKQGAWLKLKRFLKRNAEKIEDVTVSIIAEYLKKLSTAD